MAAGEPSRVPAAEKIVAHQSRAEKLAILMMVVVGGAVLVVRRNQSIYWATENSRIKMG